MLCIGGNLKVFLQRLTTVSDVIFVNVAHLLKVIQVDLQRSLPLHGLPHDDVNVVILYEAILITISAVFEGSIQDA